MKSPSQFARISAAGGAFVWFIALLIRTGDSRETDLIQKIFLLAVFVITPLCLSIISIREHGPLLRLVIGFQPLAAILCFVSIIVAQGTIAGVLASSWLALTSALGLCGFIRLLQFRSVRSFDLSITAGMIYMPIGGAWFVASRFGFQPLQFGDTIVLLTAVHFHFAGFAAPVLAGLAGHASKDTGRSLTAIGACAIVIGTPIVAAGITFSPTTALIGTFIVSLGLVSLGVSNISWVIRTLRSRSARVLLAVSSLASLIAMILACLYAYSIVTHTLIIDIPHMAVTHGLLNSFGFALCGLLAWTIELASRK